MNVELREWCTADAKNLQRIANHKLVSSQLRNVFPYPYQIEDAQGFIKFASMVDKHHHLNLAIIVDGQLAGGCSLDMQEDVKSKSAEIGYWLGYEYWQKGIGSETVKQLCVAGFNSFDIVRIFAEVFETNKSSIRILEKNGFECEGRLKKSVFKNDVLMDSFLYALCVES